MTNLLWCGLGYDRIAMSGTLQRRASFALTFGGPRSPEIQTCSKGGVVRVALISEHARPLAVIGGVDSGGQNVHVAELAAGLVRQGAGVVFYTPRDRRAPT